MIDDATYQNDLLPMSHWDIDKVGTCWAQHPDVGLHNFAFVALKTYSNFLPAHFCTCVCNLIGLM